MFEAGLRLTLDTQSGDLFVWCEWLCKWLVIAEWQIEVRKERARLSARGTDEADDI